MAITQEDMTGRDVGYNASDVRQIKAKQRDAAFREKHDEAVIRELMSTSSGRDWIWRLLGSCHVFESSFVQGQPESTAFREGERNIGLQFLGAISKADPDGYVLMQREHATHG